jgi:uncharacterized protein (DUF1810 family)
VADGVDDPAALERFVAAQNAGGTYAHALAELRAGRKSTHWMWFVFPQIAGLGHSSTALRAAPQQPVFQTVLDRYFGGNPDAATDRLL